MMGWMLGRLDTDRDGAISRAELEAEHQRHVALFDQADADHDGKVTADELHAVHARHWKDQRPEQRRQTRPGTAPQSELPSRPSQGGEAAR
jgi:Ca2+-binding EF-hand superfamily protein